jgi:hypothetical protein
MLNIDKRRLNSINIHLHGSVLLAEFGGEMYVEERVAFARTDQFQLKPIPASTGAPAAVRPAARPQATVHRPGTFAAWCSISCAP